MEAAEGSWMQGLAGGGKLRQEEAGVGRWRQLETAESKADPFCESGTRILCW